MIELVLAWMLTFPFGNVPFFAQETKTGTVLVGLPNNKVIEVLDTEMNYRILGSGKTMCSTPEPKET